MVFQGLWFRVWDYGLEFRASGLGGVGFSMCLASWSFIARGQGLEPINTDYKEPVLLINPNPKPLRKPFRPLLYTFTWD